MKSSSGQNAPKVPLYRQRRFILVLVFVVVVIASALILNYTILHFFNYGTIGCGSSMPVSTRFTVYIDYVFRRPVQTINVTQGQTITIHAWNNSTVTHEFSIAHYFDQGTNLQPGQACDLTFPASQSGTFLIYGNIPDPTVFLAQLNVNPSP